MPGWLKIAVDLLVKFQWPLVVLILGWLSVRQLRRPISLFFERAQSFTKGDVKIDLAQTAAQLETAKPNIEDLKNWGTPQALLNRKAAIRADLKNRKLDISGDTADVLISQLAVTQLLLAAEEIYYIIFGSQIFLLKRLSQNPVGLLSEQVMDFFKNLQGTFATFQSWDLQKYLAFLFARRLISSDGNKYYITDEGKEFLAWLARTGRPESKSL